MDSDFLLIRLVIMVAFGAATALAARSKGRSPIGWFFVGFFFTCIGLIVVLVMSDLKAEAAKWKLAEERTMRLKEQLKQEQLKTQAFQHHVQNRLDVHDGALGMNTRQIEGGQASVPLLEDNLPGGQDTYWFYVKDDKRNGPVALSELQNLFKTGAITQNTLVWNEKLEDWKMIVDIPELRRAM